MNNLNTKKATNSQFTFENLKPTYMILIVVLIFGFILFYNAYPNLLSTVCASDKINDKATCNTELKKSLIFSKKYYSQRLAMVEYKKTHPDYESRFNYNSDCKKWADIYNSDIVTYQTIVTNEYPGFLKKLDVTACG